MQDELGTRLDLSIVFLPQTDRMSEQIIHVLENMLRACLIDFGGYWDQFFPLAEFAYNNSYQSRIDMAIVEALYEGVVDLPFVGLMHLRWDNKLQYFKGIVGEGQVDSTQVFDNS